MSEPKTDLHDRAIERVLDGLHAEPGAHHAMPSAAEADGASAALGREYTELVGLMAFAEPSATPSAASKARLMAGLGTEAGATDEAASVGPVSPIASVATLADRRPEVVVRRSPWLLPLAALLTVCLAGLAYLAGRLDEQRSTIAELQQQMSIASGGVEATQIQTEFQAKSQNLHMITTVARQAYPMRVSDAPGKPMSAAKARGIVYVCGQHQRWYLNLNGIEPAPAGHDYRLWFHTASGVVDAGVIEVGSERVAERSALSMPDGTTGFSVTVEQEGPCDAPNGQPILIADNPVRL